MDDLDITARSLRRACGPCSAVAFAARDLDGPFRTAARPLLEWYLIQSGTWTIRVGHRRALALPGQLVVATAHGGNAGDADSATASYACVSIDLGIDRHLAPGLRHPELQVHDLEPGALEGLLTRVGTLSTALRRSAEVWGPQRIQVEVLGFLLALAGARHGPEASSSPGPRGRADRILAALATAPLDRPLDAEAIAQAEGISRRQLDRIVNAALGTSAIQHHLNLRLQRAADLLARSPEPVKRVARAVGFEDPLHFSRVFSTRHGMPPSRWRQR